MVWYIDPKTGFCDGCGMEKPLSLGTKSRLCSDCYQNSVMDPGKFATRIGAAGIKKAIELLFENPYSLSDEDFFFLQNMKMATRPVLSQLLERLSMLNEPELLRLRHRRTEIERMSPAEFQELDEWNRRLMRTGVLANENYVRADRVIIDAIKTERTK